MLASMITAMALTLISCLMPSNWHFLGIYLLEVAWCHKLTVRLNKPIKSLSNLQTNAQWSTSIHNTAVSYKGNYGNYSG